MQIARLLVANVRLRTALHLSLGNKFVYELVVPLIFHEIRSYRGVLDHPDWIRKSENVKYVRSLQVLERHKEHFLVRELIRRTAPFIETLSIQFKENSFWISERMLDQFKRMENLSTLRLENMPCSLFRDPRALLPATLRNVEISLTEYCSSSKSLFDKLDALPLLSSLAITLFDTELDNSALPQLTPKLEQCLTTIEGSFTHFPDFCSGSSMMKLQKVYLHVGAVDPTWDMDTAHRVVESLAKLPSLELLHLLHTHPKLTPLILKGLPKLPKIHLEIDLDYQVRADPTEDIPEYEDAIQDALENGETHIGVFLPFDDEDPEATFSQREEARFWQMMVQGYPGKVEVETV